MAPKTSIGHAHGTDLRFVRDVAAEAPELQAAFEQLAEADDAAVAELYDEDRESFFFG
ncbi:MAG: hypothetical protein AAF962_13015 [Actinomycetota bacterium]